MANVELSIIIISFNTKEVTKKCLESVWRSLQGSKIRYEIVVVDNNSSDGSPEMLARLSQNKKLNLVFIANKENVGFGRANNQAVKKAYGEHILLLNSDTVVLNRSIEKLYSFYRENQKKVKFVGAKLLNYDLTPQPSAAFFFSLPVVFAALFLKGDYWGLTRFSPDKTKKVDWISGACIMTSKKLYLSLGGFDETIFMYMEEVDLLYRAAKKNWATYIYPKAQIIHLGSSSSNGKTFPILQVFKGFLFFYGKHYSKISLLILKLLLKIKAFTAYFIGLVTQNQYLKKTYGEAYKMVQLVG
jgi:hypothetical protein